MATVINYLKLIKMKIDMNVISILLVVFAFFPYFLLPYIQFQSQKTLASKFKTEEHNFNLNIELKDRWNMNLIGIDFKKINCYGFKKGTKII